MRFRYVLIALLPFGAAAGCGMSPPTITPAADTAVPANTAAIPAALEDGKQRFDQHCAECHGPAAAGTDKGPPLVHIVYEPGHHPDEAFVAAALLGARAHHWQFGDMPPVPGVTPDDVAHITAYVRAEQRKVGIR